MKRKLPLLIVFLPALFGAFFLPEASRAQEPLNQTVIAGPETVEPGRLAVFETENAGAFQLWPSENADLEVDSSSKRVYFASPSEGEFTLIFAAIESDQVRLYSRAFRVETLQPKPEPDPLPDPEPDSLSRLSASEKQAVRTTLQAVLKGIQNGIVKTPNHARMEFKRILTSQLSGSVSENVSVFLTELSLEKPIGTIPEIKETFNELLETLQ